MWDSVPASLSGGGAGVGVGQCTSVCVRWWCRGWGGTVYQRLCQVVVQGLGWDSVPASVPGGGAGVGVGQSPAVSKGAVNPTPLYL